MKLKELRKLASLHKIKGRSKMNKARLEAALKPILQVKKSRKRRSVKKSRKKIKRASVYCGNNGAATKGKPIGTKHQCLKVGIGKGLYLPCERSYGGVYDPIDDRKMYCGDKIDMPPGYDILGSPSLCLKVGIGLGKAQRAQNGCRKPRRSRKTSRKRRSVKRKISRKRRSVKRKISRKRRSVKRKISRKRRSVKRKVRKSSKFNMGGCHSRSHGKCQNINKKYSLSFDEKKLKEIGVKLTRKTNFWIAFKDDTICWKIGNGGWNNCKKDGFAIAVLTWLNKIDHGLFDSKLFRERNTTVIYNKMLRYVTGKIKKLEPGKFKSNCLRK
jgi:hypothetical protein